MDLSNIAPSTATETTSTPVPGSSTVDSATVPGTPTGGEKDDKFTDNFARIARRERALRQREGKLSELEKKLQEYEAREKLASEDPFAFLEKHNLDLDRLSRRLIEDPISPEKKELEEIKAKMSAWEKEKEEKLKKDKERQTNDSYNQAKQQLDAILEKDADKYELVRLQGAQDLVFQVIYEHHRVNGRWLQLDEAAAKVEEHLEKEVSKLLEAKKLKSRFAPQTDSEPRDSQGIGGELHGAVSPSLTNLGANHASPPKYEGRVTDEELMRRALAEMKKQ